MSTPGKKPNSDKSNLFAEKDVLGLEKTKGSANTTKPHPGRIFIVIASLLILAAIYWFFTR